MELMERVGAGSCSPAPPRAPLPLARKPVAYAARRPRQRVEGLGRPVEARGGSAWRQHVEAARGGLWELSSAWSAWAGAWRQRVRVWALGADGFHSLHWQLAACHNPVETGRPVRPIGPHFKGSGKHTISP